MCVLHVSGKRLQPDDLLRSSKLEPYRIFRAGESRLRLKPEKKWEASGFSVNVSEAPWSDLHQQVEDACFFLERFADDLRQLKALDTVDDVRLNFPVGLRIKEGSLAQFEFFPPELVEKAGALRIGLELSIYQGPLEDEELDDGGEAG